MSQTLLQEPYEAGEYILKAMTSHPTVEGVQITACEAIAAFASHGIASDDLLATRTSLALKLAHPTLPWPLAWPRPLPTIRPESRHLDGPAALLACAGFGRHAGACQLLGRPTDGCACS